jgi:two-component system response regulator HydG
MARRTLPVVLVVDDDGAHRLMLRTMLEEWRYAVLEAEDGKAALDLVRKGPMDLVLMDLRMPRMDGIEATSEIARYNPAIPIIIMTAYSSIPSAVEALKSGAYDYLTKPLDFEALRLAMERALKHTHLEQENEELRRQLARLQVSPILGRSPAMQQLLEMIAMVAPTEATLLISGESGTGKGLIARAIHANGSRSSMPLVEVNCAAIPETLIESELFGHEKGAFTGAVKQRMGRFAQADGGTIFLDEIGELSLPMQVKLLRVLQEKEIQRVGSDRVLTVNVRVIAATNRNLEAMVREESFREDLYYRLNVVRIEAPPLRERAEDIPVLAKHFWETFAEKNRKVVRGMAPKAMDLLLRYPWPGNVRELENVMERAVILLRGDYISEKELPLALQKLSMEECVCEPVSGMSLAASGLTLAELEERAILQMLRDTGGNKSETARRLGITRRTLHLKLRKYAEEGEEGIDLDE